MGRRFMFYMPGLMIVTLVGIELAVLGSARLRHSGGNPDLFAAYREIMPGEPSAALNRFRCRFEKPIESGFEPTSCLIQPDDSIFTEVTAVVLFQSDRIWLARFK